MARRAKKNRGARPGTGINGRNTATGKKQQMVKKAGCASCSEEFGDGAKRAQHPLTRLWMADLKTIAGERKMGWVGVEHIGLLKQEELYCSECRDPNVETFRADKCFDYIRRRKRPTVKKPRHNKPPANHKKARNNGAQRKTQEKPGSGNEKLRERLMAALPSVADLRKEKRELIASIPKDLRDTVRHNAARDVKKTISRAKQEGNWPLGQHDLQRCWIYFLKVHTRIKEGL